MHFMRQALSYICLLLLATSLSAKPAAITFVEFDLKYNPEDGVKICEAQQGLFCMFRPGELLFNNPTIFGEELAAEFEQWQKDIWWDSWTISDPNVRAAFAARDWKPCPKGVVPADDPDFLAKATLPVEDPTSLTSYHGMVLFKGNRFKELPGFNERYPGILLADSCFQGYYRNKAKFAELFDTDEVLSTVRPEWGVFKKGYNTKLVKQILTRFPQKHLVIKPLHAYQGRGVILLKREDLSKRLRYIFGSKRALMRNKDPSYNHWAVDTSDQFIIEACYESVPVEVPHMDNRSFDGTARVLAVIYRHLDQVHVKMLTSFWQLPEKSLDELGSLNDKHKSKVGLPRYAEMQPEHRDAIEKQLQEVLPRLDHWL